MDGEEGGGIRLSKRFNDKGGEVDYKTKSGTAWSHSYLNQKPWHPLSYPNQRRKWIAEQTHAHRQRRTDEVAREYAQEQEFFRQTALISKKEKEKVELMQAVSFMYVRPPGYNAESAKAAEMADEKRKEEESSKEIQQPNDAGPSTSMPPNSLPGKDRLGEEKKKPRPKDVFGRPLPTEEEFEILKNAPRLETGVPGRVKPFGVEVRNVKCLRCGNYGHQSGDRECPLKDAIMPSEESRLKRDDPLNAILAHTDSAEPLKWELKQKPGISPPRGGFRPDDPNQQIVAEEEIFDEYGGFLSMENMPDLLTNFSKKPKKSKKSKRKKQQLNAESEASFDDGEKSPKKKKVKVNKKKQDHAKSSSSDASDFEKDQEKSRHKSSYSSDDSDSGRVDRSRKTKHEHSFSFKVSAHPGHKSKHDRQKHSFSSDGPDPDGYHRSYKNRDKHFYSSEDSDGDRNDRSGKNIRRHKRKHKRKHSRKRHSYSSDDLKNKKQCSYSSENSDSDRDNRSRKNIHKHKREHSRTRHSYSSEDSGCAGHHGNHKSRDEHSYSSDDSDHQRQPKVNRSSHKQSPTAHWDSQRNNRNYDLDRYNGDQRSRSKHSYSSEDPDVGKDDKSRRVKQKHRYIPEGSEQPGRDMSKQNRKNHWYSSRDSGADGYHISEKRRYEHSHSTESDNSDHHQRHSRRCGHKH